MTRTMLALSLIGLAACGDKDEGGEFDAILALTGDSAAGADLYSSSCAPCHGADGTGASGPSLVEHTPQHSDEQLLDVMINGSGDMAGVALSDQEAADLLAYLLDTWG